MGNSVIFLFTHYSWISTKGCGLVRIPVESTTTVNTKIGLHYIPHQNKVSVDLLFILTIRHMWPQKAQGLWSMT